jgi:hypothetical protein
MNTLFECVCLLLQDIVQSCLHGCLCVCVFITAGPSKVVRTVGIQVTGASLTTILVRNLYFETLETHLSETLDLDLVPEKSQVPCKSRPAPDKGPRATPHTSLPHDARTFSPSTTRTLREWHCFSLTRTRK